MTSTKQVKGRAKKPMTIQEMARMGGRATAKKRSPEQRKQSARKAALARWARQRGK